MQQFTTDRDSVRTAVMRATGEVDTQYSTATDRLVAETAAAPTRSATSSRP